MQPLLRDAQRSLRASPVFALYLLVTLAYAGFIGLMVAQMTGGSTSSSPEGSARWHTARRDPTVSMTSRSRFS